MGLYGLLAGDAGKGLHICKYKAAKMARAALGNRGHRRAMCCNVAAERCNARPSHLKYQADQKWSGPQSINHDINCVE